VSSSVTGGTRAEATSTGFEGVLSRPRTLLRPDPLGTCDGDLAETAENGLRDRDGLNPVFALLDYVPHVGHLLAILIHGSPLSHRQ
jgi:hypothetical protein